FDAELRIRLAREFLAAGEPKKARTYLSFDTAGDDPELLLALARLDFAEGHDEDARVAMARVLALEPAREPDIVALADSLAAEERTESAFACVDAITDAALLQGQAPRAVEVLRNFACRAPHIPALAKLVDIAAEAGMHAERQEARVQLA